MRAITQLSSMTVTQNTVALVDGAEYVMPPRNREELLATQAEAANSRHVDSKGKIIDPRVQVDSDPLKTVKGQARKLPERAIEEWLL
jgi:hypothetical protein